MLLGMGAAMLPRQFGALHGCIHAPDQVQDGERHAAPDASCAGCALAFTEALITPPVVPFAGEVRMLPMGEERTNRAPARSRPVTADRGPPARG